MVFSLIFVILCSCIPFLVTAESCPPHGNYTYTYNNGITHTQKCGNCQAVINATAAHVMTNGTCTYRYCVCGYTTGTSTHGNYTYTNNGSTHTQKCGNCQAVINTSASHTLTYTNTNAAVHTIGCAQNCGYSTQLFHSAMLYTNNGASGHTPKCICGYTYALAAHSYPAGSNTCSNCGYVKP